MNAKGIYKSTDASVTNGNYGLSCTSSSSGTCFISRSSGTFFREVLTKQSNYYPQFMCGTCGREGDYSDFFDLNDDDWNDPFTIYTVCPKCYEVARKNEMAGSILLLFYFKSSRFDMGEVVYL